MDLAMIECWIVPSILTIAAVLVLRFVLRGKISLRLQYALWAVVLVRLLLPFQIFVTPLSADALVEELDIPGTMQQAYVSANNEQYQQQYDFAYHDSVEYYESKGQQVDPVVADQRAAVTARQSLVLELRLRLMNLWLLGMAAMALVIASCNLHFALRLRRSRRTFPAADSLLPVYVTDAVPTPCVFGLFRPAIYLTSAATEDETVLRHALTHELTHYRHLDHIWSVLRSLCLVLHWYNPLVWVAAKVSRADAELACDEGALLVLGEGQRFDYGRTLVGLTCGDRIDSLFLNATTMTGSAGSLRERLKLLMKRPKTTALTLAALILVVTVIVGCTFSAAPASTVSPESLSAETTAPAQELPPSTTEPYYTVAMARDMQAYSDKHPRELTDDELAQVREAFAGTVYDAKTDSITVTPVSGFFTSYYDDVRELSFEEFLRYFPISGEATEEEFQLLRETYGDDFLFSEFTSIAQMPVPIHRYETGHIDSAFRRYTNLPFSEFQNREPVYYLEETGCFYNFTSDFGPGSFPCVAGFVYDGGAILYTKGAALYLAEQYGDYYIQAHLSLNRE